MKYCSNKDINQLIRRLVRQGWHFQNGGKHGRLISPEGLQTLTVTKSPSDYRSLYNFRRDLRKGVTVSSAAYLTV